MRAGRGGLASVLVAAFVVGGCATPSPTQPATQVVTPAASVPPAATVAPSPTASASPVALEPKVVCQANTSTWGTTDANGSQVPIVITLTCENAVAAAKAVVGPDQAVAYIEFAFGYWCPPGAYCALSLPNTGHVVFHRKGLLPNLLVGVTADDAGKVTATQPTPFPSPSPS